MLKIWAPRYHDRKVLVARYKIPCGRGIDLEITNGACKGFYYASPELIAKSPIESMRTKNGGSIQVRAIALDELERTDND